MKRGASHRFFRRRPLRSPPQKNNAKQLPVRKCAAITDFLLVTVGFLGSIHFILWYLTMKSHNKLQVDLLLPDIKGNKRSAQSLLAKVPDRKVFQIHMHPDAAQKKAANTIVTAYFQVKSKHSSKSYDEWMKNMLSLKDHMVIFTEDALVSKIQSFRQHALDRTVIVSMHLQDLPISRLQYDKDSPVVFWQSQLDSDREKKIHHSYQVFWIWLSKSWFVTTAVRWNFFESHFFMYSDIGCFRRPRYNNQELIQHPEVVPAKTVLWMAHRRTNPPPTYLWNSKLDEKEHYYHSGSQAAGSGEAWLQFHKYFANMVDDFLQHGLFIGEDQCVLQATCQVHPELCAYLPSYQVKDNNYFGLRYALSRGGTFKLWRAPNSTQSLE